VACVTLLRPLTRRPPVPYTTLFRSFAVQTGELVGFLGPNGAGKSTCMRILTTWLPASSGYAWLSGFDVMYQSNPLSHAYPLDARSEEHTSELQSRGHLVCRLLLEKK